MATETERKYVLFIAFYGKGRMTKQMIRKEDIDQNALEDFFIPGAEEIKEYGEFTIESDNIEHLDAEYFEIK